MEIEDYEGTPYLTGKDDCYELVRRWYREEYEIHLKNYARPDDFAYSGLDLIQKFFMDEGFKVKDVSLNLLQKGDVLLIRIGNTCPTVNHLGVWTGHGLLHHVADSPSRHEPLTTRWKHRTMTVLRHPEVEEILGEQVETVIFETLLSPQSRHRLHERVASLSLEKEASEVLGTDAGAVRRDLDDRGDSGTTE